MSEPSVIPWVPKEENYSSRVETWNLLFLVAKSSRFPLSPVVTSSFTYLHDFLIQKKATEYDLITVIMASFFINVKSEFSDIKVDKVIQLFAEQSQSFTQEQKTLFGQTCQDLRQAKTSMYNKKRLESQLIKAELMLLTFNNWDFISEHSMAPLIKWSEKMVKYVDISSDKKKDDFKKMKHAAVRYLCVLLISSDDKIESPEALSAAALKHALYESRDVTFVDDNVKYDNILGYLDVKDDLTWELTPKIEENEENLSNAVLC